jgi:LysR family transcriptional regulator, nitrogen assimilation regulatory protein
MQESLINGRLDIALLYNAAPAPEIEVMPLLDEALYLVQPLDQKNTKTSKKSASQSKPTSKPAKIKLAEIADKPLIIPTRPNAIRSLVEAQLGILGLRPTIALEIDGVTAILELVADGAGCAVLPQSTLQAAQAQQQSHRFQFTQITGLSSRLSLATSSQRPSTLTQRAMQELITRLTPSLVQAS